ncbi:hypothetical protein GCM10020229_11130 [Kitasatospora albolonga]
MALWRGERLVFGEATRMGRPVSDERHFCTRGELRLVVRDPLLAVEFNSVGGSPAVLIARTGKKRPVEIWDPAGQGLGLGVLEAGIPGQLTFQFNSVEVERGDASLVTGATMGIGGAVWDRGRKKGFVCAPRSVHTTSAVRTETRSAIGQ